MAAPPVSAGALQASATPPSALVPVRPVGAAGATMCSAAFGVETTASDHSPAPTMFAARTRKSYAVPLVRSETVVLVPVRPVTVSGPADQSPPMPMSTS